MDIKENETGKMLASLSAGKTSGAVQAVLDRRANRGWLNHSRKIALQILDALQENQMTQKFLAEKLLMVSPQYVSRVVRGKENLTLEQIAKFEQALGIELITFGNGRLWSPTVAHAYEYEASGKGVVIPFRAILTGNMRSAATANGPESQIIHAA